VTNHVGPDAHDGVDEGVLVLRLSEISIEHVHGVFEPLRLIGQLLQYSSRVLIDVHLDETTNGNTSPLLKAAPATALIGVCVAGFLSADVRCLRSDDNEVATDRSVHTERRDGEAFESVVALWDREIVDPHEELVLLDVVKLDQLLRRSDDGLEMNVVRVRRSEREPLV